MKSYKENYFFGSKYAKKSISINGKNLYIKLLSVYEAILCKTYSEQLFNRFLKKGLNEEYSVSVCENACLCSLCLKDNKNNKAFKNGLAVLKSITPEELLKIVEEYYKLKNKFIGFNNIDLNTINTIKKKLSTPTNRIKWKVLKGFNILPGSDEAKKMYDCDYLYCYINMLIDENELISEQGTNTNFDFSEYQKRSDLNSGNI